MKTCAISGCNNSRSDESVFCDEHRCKNITVKGNRCKSSFNCKINHKAQIESVTEREEIVVPANKDEFQFKIAETAIFNIGGYGPVILQKAQPEVKQYVFDNICGILSNYKKEYGSRLVVVSTLDQGMQAAMARAAIKLGITLHVILSNGGFGEHYWTGRDETAKFRELVEAADRVDIISDTVYVPTPTGKRHSNIVRDQIVGGVINAAIVYSKHDANAQFGISRMRMQDKKVINIATYNRAR